MFNSKKIVISGILFLLMAFNFKISMGADTINNINSQPAQQNSLSKYYITHTISGNEITINIKNKSSEKINAFIENNKLIIRQHDKNNSISEENYTLPVYVNENNIKTKNENNQITLIAPIIKNNQSNSSALNNRINRLKTWNSINQEMDELFNFNNNDFDNDEIFGKNFFNNEMKQMDKQIKNMMKMQENLTKNMKNRLNKGNINITNEVSLNVTDKIENDNIIITITGNPLDNLDIKVKDNVLTIQNKIMQITESTTENEISKFNYNSMSSQSFTLPAKVDNTKMKIDKQKDKIIVTLPIIK